MGIATIGSGFGRVADIRKTAGNGVQILGEGGDSVAVTVDTDFLEVAPPRDT